MQGVSGSVETLGPAGEDIRLRNSSEKKKFMELYHRVKAVTSRYSALMVLYTLSSATQAFPMVSIGSILNQELQCSASEAALYYALIFIPWNFRSVYGLISDSVSIQGYRRKSYIVLCNSIVSCGYLCYGIFVSSLNSAILCGIMINVFFAFSEAVLDAISIDKIREFHPEASSEERSKLSSDIQSASMCFRTIGSILSVMFAGLLSHTLSPRTLTSVSGVFPFLMVIVCCITYLEPSQHAEGPKVREFFSYMHQCIRTRRWPLEMFRTIMPILLPSIFVLVYASCPTSNVAYAHYLYTETDFTQFQFHMIAQFTSIGGLIGTGIFWLVFRKIKSIQTIFIYSIVIAAVAATSRLLVLLAHWDSFAFIAFDETIVNIASRITLMPVQVYASIAASHPNHYMYEGFVFGFFASIENWGGAISGLISSAIADRVDLSTLVIISATVSFVPLMCLTLLNSPNKESSTNEIQSESTVI